MTVMNFMKKHLGLKMNIKIKFEVHSFVEKYCKNGEGIEIGGAAHNTFDIKAKNVDICDHKNPEDVYRKEQLKLCNKVKPVDIIASGDDIPLKDNSVDFVFSSHAIEHFYNLLSAIREWIRIVKDGGYIVMLVPNKLYTFDLERDCTSIDEFKMRDKNYERGKIYPDMHHSVWTLESFLEFAK